MLDITQRIRSLQLPEGSYMVIGGGILTALGIRELHDIDILTTPEIFAQYQHAGWKQVVWVGQPGLRGGIGGVFEMGTQVHGYYLADLLPGAYYIEGIPYINIELLYLIKAHLRRPEDLRDLALLEPYRQHFCVDCLRGAQGMVAQMYRPT